MAKTCIKMTSKFDQKSLMLALDGSLAGWDGSVGGCWYFLAPQDPLGPRFRLSRVFTGVLPGSSRDFPGSSRGFGKLRRLLLGGVGEGKTLCLYL